MTPDATTPTAIVEKRSRRTRVAVVLVLVAGLAVLGWFWRHPEAFARGGWGTGSDSWAVNAPLYVGMSYARPEATGTVTIHTVSAHDLSAPADAVVEFFVCTIDPTGDASAIGAVGEPIGDSCSSLVPAEGAELELDAKPLQQLVVAMTLPTPGQLTMSGIDVTYSYGWQRGTQRIGADIHLRAVAKGT